jgi:small subunit ribosomal protein S6
MAQEAPIYDLTLLLDPSAEDERREKILADVEGLIDRHGGTLRGRHDWGVRQSAYEVRKRAEADYHLVQFYSTNEVLEALDHTLKITDGVLRFRIIKLRPGTPEPPDLRTAAAGATAGTEPDEE